VQSHVDVVHGARSKTRVELVAVEGTQVVRGECPELRPAESRLDVDSADRLVALPGPLPDGVLDAIREPRAEVLREFQVRVVKDETAIRIRHRLSEPPLALAFLLRGDVAALPVRAVVGSEVADNLALLVLARVDRTRAIAPLSLFRHC
jgi:hypothetical protein